MVIDHEVNVPKSPKAKSAIASLQVPFGTENKLLKFGTFEAKIEGPHPIFPSAAKVPVNGAAPVANDVEEVELIVVFIKLSPDPPLAPTRLRILPFGATRLISISSSHVCVILKLTLMLCTTPVTPATTNGCEAPVTGSLSGIGTLIAPEEMVVVRGGNDDVVIDNGCTSSTQIVAEAGDTTGVGGTNFTFTVAVFWQPVAVIVPVTVYVVLLVGVAVTVAPVVLLSPAAGVHE